MSDTPNGKVGNGATVGLSALVAGVAGTVVSTLFSKKESRQERAQQQIEERLAVLEGQAALAMDRLGEVGGRLNQPYLGDSRRARQRARELGKAATRAAERTAAATRRQIADLDREAIRIQSIERANQLGSEGSLRAKELARTLNDRTTHLVAETRTQLPEWRSRTSQSASTAIGRGSSLAQQAIEGVPDVRDKLAAQARGASTGVIDKASKTSRQVLVQARDRAPEVGARARELASEASDRALQLANDARTHTPGVAGSIGSQVATALHDVQESVKPVVGDVTALASRLVEEAKEAGSHAGDSLIPDVQHRVEDVAGKAKAQGLAGAATVSALGATAADRLAHTTDAIEQQSKAAASAAGRGTKDGGAFALWTITAAGLVYYAFLDEEQRQKAKEAGQRILAEIQDVYRDIRGYDEEFS